MEKHERGCTLNPDRVCGLCAISEHDKVLSLSELIDVLGNGSSERFAKLREAANECPACILAAIRQSPNIRGSLCPIESDVWSWEFKPALDAFWINHDDVDRDYS
jgi:hypothetical protein